MVLPMREGPCSDGLSGAFVFKLIFDPGCKYVSWFACYAEQAQQYTVNILVTFLKGSSCYVWLVTIFARVKHLSYLNSPAKYETQIR